MLDETDEDYLPPEVGVPPFRSICRYIENATLYRFAKAYLGNGHCAVAATNADIEEFCAQAKVEQFAAKKQLLYFGFDDDASAKASLSTIDSDQPSSSLHTHVFDKATGALVTSHLYRHRDAIAGAFRACRNLTEFRFSRPWEYSDNHHPRRSIDDVDEDDPSPFNITSSVAYVLSLAERAGIRLETMFVHDVYPDGQDVRVGVSDCAFLSKHKDVLQNPKFFGLRFIEDPSKPIEEVGSRLGKQINEALADMPALQSLRLSFAPGFSIDAWTAIANGSATTTTLSELFLDDCHIDLRDLAKILSSMPTLTRLVFSDLHLYKGFRDDLAQVFLGLANGPCELDCFTLSHGGPFMGKDEEITFPSALRQPCWDTLCSGGEIEDQDEWIGIEVCANIHWVGRDDIE